MRLGLEGILWINDLSEGLWMRSATCNIKSFYRAGSLVTILIELSKYELD
jgi:hypothetical protein